MIIYLNLLLSGEEKVGKTTIINRFKKGEYDENYAGKEVKKNYIFIFFKYNRHGI